MNWLEHNVEQQRAVLSAQLGTPMAALAARCAAVWRDKTQLDEVLRQGLAIMPLSQLVFAMDASGRQMSANVHAGGLLDDQAYGQDLAARPFVAGVAPWQEFLLSVAYISRVSGRPCLTAVQRVAGDGGMLGFVAADFDLRDLQCSEQPVVACKDWRQIKGDPVIRANLFQQQRVRSEMDQHLDDVISIMEELICERGVFHSNLHFSSSCATLWLMDDPYSYHLHVLDEIIDPAVCLAYPRRAYSPRALVRMEQVRVVFERFKLLREADEVIYLRAGSLNVVNGMVSLTFSCDGSHYMMADEFLAKENSFWFGSISAPSANATTSANVSAVVQ